MSKTIDLYQNDDFESWTDDSDNPLIFIHIVDRGLSLSFCQKQWFEFMRNIKMTNNKIKCKHCYHEIKSDKHKKHFKECCKCWKNIDLK